jgi:outer membrane protein assembly factor BamB
MFSKPEPFEIVLPGLATIAGASLILFWLQAAPVLVLEERSPDRDGTVVSAADDAVSPVAGEPIKGDATASDHPGEWPAFRGPNGDAISTDPTELARSWPAEGPPQLWSIEVGEGYAAPVISKGRVYLLDYDKETEADTLRCLSLDTGREIWRNSYPVLIAFHHGMSRTVPVVVDNYVITIGPRCQLACWDATTGENKWLTDLVIEHGSRVPEWYTGQCPLIDEGRLIVAPCGEDALMMAMDYETGEVIWKTPNPKRWNMTHVSVVPMDFQGRRTYVYCASGGTFGVAADDGSLLWDTVAWKEINATGPSPLILPDDKIFLSRGYGSGAMILQLAESNGQIEAKTILELKPRQFNSEQQTPILRDGHIFGLRKKGAKSMLCLDLDGNEVWSSGSERFGLGPYMFADDLLLILDDGGTLTLAEATTAGFQRLAQHDVWSEGHDAWGPMAIAGGRLIVRDMTRMVCLDLSKR